jgi:hypothetical protein
LSYAADPGGVFASDAHRRVMAHLPNPGDDPVSVEDLIGERINNDPHTLAHFDASDEVAEVLADLEADGYAKKLKNGWRNTPDGFDALTGPPNISPPDAVPVLGLDPAKLSTNGES